MTAIVVTVAFIVAFTVLYVRHFRRRFPNRVTDRPITPLREHAAFPVPRHLVVEPPPQAVY
jgi:hypothetical protein